MEGIREYEGVKGEKKKCGLVFGGRQESTAAEEDKRDTAGEQTGWLPDG